MSIVYNYAERELTTVSLEPSFRDILATLDKEQTRVKIRLEARRFGKPATIIEGLRLGKAELETLSRKLKKTLATGGTVRENEILLQGDQRQRAAKMLVDEGFQQNAIEII